jgi:hypothetical protein
LADALGEEAEEPGVLAFMDAAFDELCRYYVSLGWSDLELEDYIGTLLEGPDIL